MKKDTSFISSTLIYCALVASFFISSCANSSTDNKTEQPSEKVLYQCPMDCESGKTYQTEATCPVCGMDLEKTDTPI